MANLDESSNQTDHLAGYKIGRKQWPPGLPQTSQLPSPGTVPTDPATVVLLPALFPAPLLAIYGQWREPEPCPGRGDA